MKKLLLLLFLPSIASAGTFLISQTANGSLGQIVFTANGYSVPFGNGMLHAQGGPTDLVPSQIWYTPFGLGNNAYHGGDHPFTNEIQAQVPMGSTGTITGLWVSITANGITGGTSVRLRKNGLNVNSVVNLSSSGNEVQDKIHSDTFQYGDKLDFQIVTGAGTSSGQINWIAYTVTTVSGDTLIWTGSENTTTNSSTNGFATYYNQFSIFGLTDQTESSEMYQMQTSGTANNCAIYVSTNTRNQGASSFTLRKNGASTTQSISIPQGATGLLQDTTNSVSYVIGDTVTYAIRMDQGNGSNVLGISFVKCEFTTTNKTVERPVNTNGHVFQAGDNNFLEFIGAGGFDSGEIDDYRLLQQQPGTLSNCRIYFNTNTLNQAVNLTLRQNQADSAISLAIPSGSTGEISLPNTLNILGTDFLDWHETVSAGATGQANWVNTSCLFTRN